ncbi:MAG: hypothetical protein U0031_20220 [Thermomicrobiales bacterium]
MTRVVDAPLLVERFLTAGVVTVLLIRAWLAATGYPQIGGHGLHIAHMLFGGAGMLAALLVSLTLLGARPRVVATIVGGIGFGAFIDELGKFITSDNNYFYRPAVALIYVVFVLLVIAGDRLARDTSPTPEERLAQATNIITNGVLDGFSPSDRLLALQLLGQSNQDDPLVNALQGAVQQTETRPDKRPDFAVRMSNRIGNAYTWTITRRWFLWLVLAVAAFAIVFSLRELSIAIFTDPNSQQLTVDIDSTDGLLLISNVIAGVLLIVGLIHLRPSRLEAYRWFRRATLVFLLIAQPLAFYEQQWTALIGLVLSLALLSALNYGIDRESTLSGEPDYSV